MRLANIAENTKLQIEVAYKVTKLYYDAHVKLTAFNGAFIEPIKQDEKMLEFNSGNLLINVTADIEGAQPVLWRDCIIKGVRYKQEVYHMITCPRGGLAINRRGRFRIDMGYTGTIRIGHTATTINVVVHDLSASGFSFTTEKNLDDFSDDIHLVFVDTKNDTNLKFIGEIVRKQNWNNNRFLYGCKFKAVNNMVEYYIAKKQREMLALNTIKTKNIIDLKDEK